MNHSKKPIIVAGLILRRYFLSLVLTAICNYGANSQNKTTSVKPVINGPWWNITSLPDIGEYNNVNQEAVDFGVWQASDGTWQLWSCIRGTNIGGNSRLFYHWQGKSLTDTSWKPEGIAMVADTSLGETAGGLQAPFVLKEKGIYYMFYGDWNNICLATSKDGKKFTRVINRQHTTALFSGPLHNTRDPMVLKRGDTYYCYYSSNNEKDNKLNEPQGAVYCRISKNLKTWGDPVAVSRGGIAQHETPWFSGDIECPFVVGINDQYILFRNQRYGPDYLNTQYCSKDPLNFGDNKDDYMVGQLPVAAPEIVKHGDQYYIISLKPDLKGMKIAKLKFVQADTAWWPSVWGADDQRGAMNRLSNQNVLKATRLIKNGRIYQLGRTYEPEMPIPNGRPYSLIIPGTPTFGPFGSNQVVYNVEMVYAAMCQIGTQFDGLGHVAARINNTDRYYNGMEGNKILSPTGLKKLGVEHVGDFFTRGVLLDVARYKGTERLNPGYVISAADVEGTLKKENIKIEEGDVVLIYTGQGNLWKTDNKAYLGDQPGIGMEAARMLADKKIVMVGADNIAVEALPAEDKNKIIECHQFLLSQNGIYLFENLDLKKLADDRVYEFAFIYSPIPFKGATGSPGSPIAVY